jgi:sortase A
VIPSIGLDAPIQDVGIDQTGAMAVPSGKTNNVGWYEYGTIPGQAGAAVIDAHVFAAFSKLNQLKSGDDIYVVTQSGEILHFAVASTKTFALNKIQSSDLFTQTSDRALNLITCAGNLTADHSTYDHRLVVYTTLVS